MNGEHQPFLAGVKMKDGKVYTYESVVDGSGEQFETGSSGKLYGKFTETVTTKKILEVKQIKHCYSLKNRQETAKHIRQRIIMKYRWRLKNKKSIYGEGL